MLTVGFPSYYGQSDSCQESEHTTCIIDHLSCCKLDVDEQKNHFDLVSYSWSELKLSLVVISVPWWSLESDLVVYFTICIPGHCNVTWDRILCWDQTPAGQTVRQPCPRYVLDMSKTGNYTTWITQLTTKCSPNFNRNKHNTFKHDINVISSLRCL